jgi:hypothetical protein
MAIQPVDLQLAYLAAPASAAIASNSETAPAIAAQAQQAAFAADVERREESVAETAKAEGAIIRPDRDGGNGGTYSPPKKRKRGVDVYEGSSGLVEEAPSEPGEQHFIDTTA